MSRSNVRGPTSALTEFLRASGITPTTIAQRVATRTETQPAAGPSNTQAEGETPEQEPPSRRSRQKGKKKSGYASDELDDPEEEGEPAPNKKRKLTKAAEAKLKAKERAKAGKGGSDTDGEDDAYTALSKSLKGMNIPKPPVGSFEDCAKCEKQFTVTKYTMAANPGPGFLCHQCAKATGSDPFKKPAVPKKRKTPAEKRTVTNFDDKRFPSLVSICVQLVTRHINDVEALGDIGAMNTAAIAKAISKNRSLTPENAVLFYNVENTALTFYDATSLTPPALTTLAYLNPNLTSLKLDFCGRIDDKVMNAFATSLPQLTRIELLGPFLVRPAAWIAFFNTRQAMTAFLITQSPRFDLDCVKALITSCGDTLRELRLKEVGKLDDDFLAELAKARSLTQLDLADPSKSCSPGAVIELMSAVGRNLTLLDLSGHNLLTDDFLNLGIAEYAHALSSLSLAHLNELTDVGVSAFFENWNTNPGLKDIDMSRIYALGENALPSLLKHSGATVIALNLNGWGGVTAESLDILGRHTVGAELRKLDVGWWREVDDYVVRGWMGLDNNDDAGEKRKRGCLKLEELKVWGCNRVTPRCPVRRGVRGVRIYGIESQTL